MDNFNTIAVNKNTTVLSMVNSYSKRNITDADKIAYIKVLLLKTILMVVMYDLRETNIYQKGVKKSGNEFIRELEKVMFDSRYYDMLQSDPGAVEELEKNMELIANEISLSDLGCFAVITEVLRKYQKEPDYVLDRLNILKGDSEEIKKMERREDLTNRINKLPETALHLIERQVEGLENIYII